MASRREKVKQSVRQSASELNNFFSGASQKPIDSPKKPTKRNTKAEPETVSEKPQKVEKKVFSFRAEVEMVDSWRVWADAKGLKVDELGEKAINEYIKRHSLTADQQKIYDLKMAQKKS